MAERRMFTQKIVDSDAFLDMPLSTQCLYFHLNMRADDDGFLNNPKKIQRMIGASDDDLRLLLAKRFILGFESGVIVIKHWRMHNLLRKDRYNPTQYQEEMQRLALKENGAYTDDVNHLATTWQPDDNQLATQDSIDKDSIDKDTNNRSNLSAEFDYLWTIYPRKQGKKRASDAYMRARKKGTSFEEVEKGIKGYLNYIRIERIKPEYIKQGSTFFSQQAWQDDWRPRKGVNGVIVTDAKDDELDGIL
jgi:hypothetical protein